MASSPLVSGSAANQKLRNHLKTVVSGQAENGGISSTGNQQNPKYSTPSQPKRPKVEAHRPPPIDVMQNSSMSSSDNHQQQESKPANGENYSSNAQKDDTASSSAAMVVTARGDAMSTMSHVSTLLPPDLTTQLTHLNLSYMNLKTVPSDLALFTNLIRLHLNDNRLTDIMPFMMVKNLTKLQFLDLSNNRIPNLYEVVILGHLKELRELNLLGNPIGNIGNRPALIQELLFRDWKPLHEEDGYYDDEQDDDSDAEQQQQQDKDFMEGNYSDGDRKRMASPHSERLDSPLTPGTPQVNFARAISNGGLAARVSSPSRRQQLATASKKATNVQPHRARAAQALFPNRLSSPNRESGGDAHSNSSRSPNEKADNTSSRPKSAHFRSEDALLRQYGYIPSPKGTPRIKRVIQNRPNSAFMKRTTSFLNREKKARTATSFDGSKLPSTLNESRYSMKNLQSMKKTKIVIDRDAHLDDEESTATGETPTSQNTKQQDPPAPAPLGYQAYEEKEDRMRKFLERFRPSDMRAFKDSLSHLLDSFKSTSEIIHRLKDIPVPRLSYTPFPYLLTLNRRNISVEEYLIAENEEVFDICTMGPKKVRRQRPATDWIDELDLDDTPFEWEPTGYINNKHDFKKSAQLTDTLNYIRVNHHRPDIANVSTYSDARFKVRDDDVMVKILDKSCKAEYVEIDDYKSIEGAKKWSKMFSNFSSDLGSINFNDVLRWEHKQIKKRADKLIGKKKKSRSHHVAKHRFENLSFDQVETTMRKMELNCNISSSKRNVRPVQPHNPHQVSEFCRQERIQRRKLAKKHGADYSQRHISSRVLKNHPEDDIVNFFSSTTKQFSREANSHRNRGTVSSVDDIDSSEEDEDYSGRSAAGVRPKFEEPPGHSARLSPNKKPLRSPMFTQEKKKELLDTNETIRLGGQEFSYSELML